MHPAACQTGDALVTSVGPLGFIDGGPALHAQTCMGTAIEEGRHRATFVDAEQVAFDFAQRP